MSKLNRKRLYVDSQVQGVIVRRALIYLTACGLFMLLPIFIGRAVVDPRHLFFENLGQFLRQYAMFFTCLGLMVPLVIIDVLRWTNRFAGPFFRLRRELNRLAEGEKVQPLKFGDGDHWCDVADSFNAVTKRIETLEQARDDREKDESTSELICS